MRVYRSNRVERLLDALADLTGTPGVGPLQRETIVVQSRGMAVWLGLQLAGRHGVWTGADFPFPRRFVDDLLQTVLADEADGSQSYTRARLQWTILDLLPEVLSDRSLGAVRKMVAADPQQRHRFGLARKLADVFDRYIVYRPDLLLKWQHGSGGDDDWQATLWRRIVDRLGPVHLAALAKRLLQRLQSDERIEGLPPRISIFGASSLPPLFLQIARALDRRCEVHLFLMSPSREYWAEVRSRREILRQKREQPVGSEQWLSEGHPLLASLGSVGRDFQRILERDVDYIEPAGDLYEIADRATDDATPTMLRTMIEDIVALRDRGGPEGPAPMTIAPTDGSIQVHACHSPMRQVEVLHDQLLERLAGGGPGERALRPDDVVVMVPDMQTFAPLVEAVFERRRGDAVRIPYCIADRPAQADSPVFDAFDRITALPGSRVTASELLDLLAIEAIGRRFELTNDDVERIGGWVSEAGIRWGMDAAHRRAHGQPGTGANTWHFGLHRLLLGYALPGADRETWAGALPFDELEGHEARVLGRLAEFCQTLFATMETLAAPRPPAQWLGVLSQTLDSLIAPDLGTDAGDWDQARLRGAIEAVVDDAVAAGMNRPVHLAAMADAIRKHLDDERPARGFLTGGVTFCETVPMRGIPFELVCLVGLSDEAFPRHDPLVGFDKIRHGPRIGDRSRRDDDRYLFLEAVMAARRGLIITYEGQSIQDGSELPPSVVVSELLDALDRGFVGHDGRRPRDVVTVEHPMQPFSPRYFGADRDPRLWSYAEDYRHGAKALSEGRAVQMPPLLTEPLPPLTLHDVELARFIRFFSLPAAQLLKSRVGVRLDEWARLRSDREPMELSGLTKWRLGSVILQHRMQRMKSRRSLELLQASGMLPHGALGVCAFEDTAATVEPLAQMAEHWCGDAPLPPLAVDLDLDGTRVVGQLGDRFAKAIVGVQYGKIQAKHLLGAWIRHLVNTTALGERAGHTVLIGRPDKLGAASHTCVLRPVQEPRDLLLGLMKLYRTGMSEPLLLMPRCGLEFCRSFQRNQDVEAALAAAIREWDGGRGRGEGDDPHLRRIFGDRMPLSHRFTLFDRPMAAGDFAHLSVEVFGPLLAHLQED